jgi:4-hydroxyphenylacetate 3-monooxygenase
MGIKTGQAYVESLRDGRALYVNGERIKDVTQSLPYRGIVDEMAAHFDRPHDPKFHSRMTYPSPINGAPVSNSFRLTEN